MTDSFYERQRGREAMYGDGNLAGLTIFSGNFINYGHWAQIDLDAPLSKDDRTRSQADLYRQVLTELGEVDQSRVLEIGCGIGVGAALVLDEFGPASLHGLDQSVRQLLRAAQAHGELLDATPRRLRLAQGSAMALPFGEASFDAVYSVEAAQHFDDLTGFAAESFRVLRPGGRLAVATFFATGTGHADELARLIETIANGIDTAHPIASFESELVSAGFCEVAARSIGPDVWRGLDLWIAGTEYADSWGRNWYKAYRGGLVDYFVVTATKPR